MWNSEMLETDCAECAAAQLWFRDESTVFTAHLKDDALKQNLE